MEKQTMKGIVKRVRKLLLSPKPSATARFKFYDTGFHGDIYLLKLVDLLMSRCGVFVETGTNVGSTLAYVAKRFPHSQCFSCEPDQAAYNYARKNTENCANVNLFNEMSETFLERILKKKNVVDAEVLFWIDAHGYGFQWPLREEVKLITSQRDSAFVLIDDFRVPGLDCFGYDRYGDQECSFDYIKEALSNTHEYCMYYPTYTDRTSKHHPLRGWCLLDFGHATEIAFSESLKGRVRRTLN
jgi:hypothetical protein